MDGSAYTDDAIDRAKPYNRGPVEPPFGCSSLRLVAEPVERIVSRIADRLEGDERQPRYYAEGRLIVTAHTGRAVPPPRAREALFYDVEAVLATTHDELVEGDILRIGDLIRAIRAAERNDPLPPASVARAA